MVMSCNVSGSLIRIKRLQETSPEAVIKFMNPQLGKGEIKEFAAFLSAVMQLEPGMRPTAAELLEHPWIKG